jgi:ferredoxin-nitrite reductase
MNKIGGIQKREDGLEILRDVPSYAAEGWEKISDGDKERLKWPGSFFAGRPPAGFMMRLRIPNGFMSAMQLRTIGEISSEFARASPISPPDSRCSCAGLPSTTFRKSGRRLRAVDLISLQTGMDNIRGVIGCPSPASRPTSFSTHRRWCVNSLSRSSAKSLYQPAEKI